MSKFVIRGGGKINGEVRISGMKNAATPLLAATLLTRERCILRNVPRIRDVFRMLDIMKGLGARVEWVEDHALAIEAASIDSGALPSDLVAAMRSSILLLGPLLVRAGEVEIPEPGGCIIGNRPIDTHLSALAELGASSVRKNGKYLFQAPKLQGATIILPEFSVTATENVLMAACRAEGKTVIKLAAAEPHVQDLIAFLEKMGARITGSGTHTLTIEGVAALHGAEHALIPDQIEIGTFAATAGATRGSIEMYPVISEHLDIILLKLRQAGVQCDISGDRLRVCSEGALRAFRLQAMPYPGFPTDLQAPFGVLATQCSGTTLIHDPLFEGRMGYVGELVKMGAGAIIADPHRVIITGPTPLYGQRIRSLDLRAGATLVIAGIVAEGETVIEDAEVIDRGYEDLDGRLRALGAKIDRVE